MRLLPFGDDAVLAEYASLDDVLRADAALRDDPLPGVVDVVPAARTILVRFDRRAVAPHAVRRWLTETPAADGPATSRAIERVPVRYDGPDLADCAASLDMSPETLVARHTGATWIAAFAGFAPGFAYLASPELRLDVPRRSTSRERVPAGSVGLAGEFSGVYPRASPGGWQLIGSTELPLWDETRTQPALLAPGTTVRFDAIR